MPAHKIHHAAERQAAEQTRNISFGTGPRTAEGKNTSKWNSFKHGLYAEQLVLPGEDPAQLEALKADLRAEHQPGNTTEEILVNEIAEQFWRVRRMRRYEAHAMRSENFPYWFEKGLLVLIARKMASAERGMHKAIATLRQLQKDRKDEPAGLSAPKTQANKFVPSKKEATEPEFVPQNDPEPEFVPQNSEHLEFVSSCFDEEAAQSSFENSDQISFSPPSRENAA